LVSSKIRLLSKRHQVGPKGTEYPMKKPEPILVTALFPPTLENLILLLDELTEGDWQKSTVCSGWSVKYVAQHLLGVEISNISRKRDNYTQETSNDLTSNQELLEFINELNENWVHAADRISPRLLIDLLSHIGKQANELFAGLDPFALSGPVSWAGPDPAPVWLDLAREYTERWHHQQHIRDAVGRPGLKEPRYFAPILDAFVRALPYTFKDTPAPKGVSVNLIIEGDSGGEWTIQFDSENWELFVGRERGFISEVVIEQEDAWRLFTKGINREAVFGRSIIRGNEDLGLKLFDMVSIIA